MIIYNTDGSGSRLPPPLSRVTVFGHHPAGLVRCGPGGLHPRGPHHACNAVAALVLLHRQLREDLRPQRGLSRPHDPDTSPSQARQASEDQGCPQEGRCEYPSVPTRPLGLRTDVLGARKELASARTYSAPCRMSSPSACTSRHENTTRVRTMPVNNASKGTPIQ
eukprot:3522396-Pyramimonas_sp.AAC.1